MTNYIAFNMKDVLQEVREYQKKRIEDIKKKIEDKKEKWEDKLKKLEDELKREKELLSYINNIPDDITVEELPIYREYLSKFAVSPFFRDKPLLADDDVKLSKADSDLFLKLVCGSFSSSYQIAYNEEKGGLELVIHVDVQDKHITKKLDELWWFQIERMFIIYLDELFSLEYYLVNNINKDDIEEAFEIRLVTFEKNMRMLEEKHRQARIDNEDVDAELDALLGDHPIT